jgi:hypothetical protein
MATITEEEFLEILKADSVDDSAWKGCVVFKGLTIIAKYIDPNKNVMIGSAAHDQIWAVGLKELVDAGITKEDAVALRNLNWMEDCEGLSHFI